LHLRLHLCHGDVYVYQNHHLAVAVAAEKRQEAEAVSQQSR